MTLKMPPSIETVAPPLRVDETGAIRVGDSKITLDLIIEAHQLGETPEAIARNWPSVSLAEVYATIAYYLAHRSELDAYLEAGRRQYEEWRARSEADPKNQELREKIRARARERGLR
jgi:uncharacterized protein (DUF433 family)